MRLAFYPLLESSIVQLSVQLRNSTIAVSVRKHIASTLKWSLIKVGRKLLTFAPLDVHISVRRSANNSRLVVVLKLKNFSLGRPFFQLSLAKDNNSAGQWVVAVLGVEGNRRGHSLPARTAPLLPQHIKPLLLRYVSGLILRPRVSKVF